MEKWAMLPKVKKIVYLEGGFFLDKVVIKANMSEAVIKVLQTALGWVECCVDRVNLEIHSAELKEEEYTILITQKGIEIQYATMKGLFYSIITLKHLQKQFGSTIPCMSIWDYPDLPIRGILYDISRNKVPKLETLYLLVDMMSDLKYNQLQLYIEGLSFEYESVKQYLADECYIKKSEIVSLQAYCKERFIELIPNHNTLGHMTEWLDIEEFGGLARNPEGEIAFGIMQRPGTLNPEISESELFVERLASDMLPLFESKYYNVNLDEAFGITEPHLYQDWLQKMYHSSNRHGKQMMMWSDMLISFGKEIDEIPSDITLLDWGYEDHYPFDTECRELENRKLNFYLCPGTSSWCSITGRTDNMLHNVDKAIDCAHRYGAKGILMTDWGDAGHWQVLPVSYPGFVYAAAKAWNKETVLIEELSDYLNDFIFEDVNRQMGKLSLMIGRTYHFDDFRILNGSMFHHQLVMGLCSKEDLEAYVKGLKDWMIPYANRFYNDGGRELINQIEDRKDFDYSSIKKHLETMEGMLQQSDMKRMDAVWLKMEYKQSLQLLILAVELRKYIENDSILQKGKRKEMLTELKQLVQSSEELFKRTWRNRNKESHLDKSCTMFEQIIGQITLLSEE